MALGSKPTLQQVWNEFTSPTRATLAQAGLREMMVQAFSGSASGKSLLTFANTGRPTYTTASASSIGTDRATLNATISNEGSTTNRGIRFRYSQNSNMSSSSTTSWITDGSTNPSVLVTGLNMNTVYYFQVEFYNGFNQADPFLRPLTPISFTTLASCSPPTSLSTIFVVMETQVGFSWTQSGDSGTNQIQWSVNGGSYAPSTPVTESGTNFTQNRHTNDAYTLRYRIRRDCGSSNFSNWQETSTANIPEYNPP